MTDRQQLRQVCAWNRQLARENGSLRAELHRARCDIEALEAANARSGAEAEASECFLVSSMTEARRGLRRP
jgi:hypothetical protein